MNRGDIAIIGMAGRFPGSRTLEEYWANLAGGVESIRRLTDDELMAAGVPAEALTDPTYVKACPVLDDISHFDAGFFGFSPRDAAVMDPAHRLFLEVAWEAMEHAGHTGLPDEGPVGVFATSGAPYYLMDNVRRDRALMKSMGEFLARHTNNDMNFLATRVSYEMDLRGPSLNIQTACSSALVSIHVACESIRNGDCVMALAGGSTVNVPGGQGYFYQEGEILSPDGHCRPFDARSAGTVFGSGCGCVVLKSLAKALDDGDTIYAVIKGSAINNDGAQRVGYLAPGVEGQAAVVSSALADAGVTAEQISYVEAHGTGTAVGDPIEVTALAQAFGAQTSKRQFCALASVKSNIGHLGEAAGVASLIKAVLSLQHRQLAPSLGYEQPNPQIDFANGPFFVNDRLRDWASDGPRRCGITALGAGGTNCHLILEEAPPAISGEGARPSQLIVVSAKSDVALERSRDLLATALGEADLDGLADAAYTLAMGRRPMRHRAAVVARTGEQAAERLAGGESATIGAVADANTRVVFMFPGGGAQYARMGIELYEVEPAFREAADRCFAIASRELGRDLRALMYAAPADVERAGRELERPSLSLPALFTTEYALAALFRAWGLEPDATIGHSMGEYVSACLAGVMTLEDALRMVMLRGRLFESVAVGRMLSVPMAEAELTPLLPPGLSIAAVNAPRLCVASGPESAISALEQLLSAREIDTVRVRIEVAAHSAMLEPILDEFGRFCRSISLRPPQLPFVSNVSGRWITAAEATDPMYWVRHLRSTVRFADGMETLRGDGDPCLIEVGPGRTLTTLARAQQRPATRVTNSMRHPEEAASDLDFALSTLGRAWTSGASVEWSAFYEAQLRNRVPLPTYPWDHQRYWIEPPPEVSAAATPVPGAARRSSVEEWFQRPVWQSLPPAAPAVRVDETLVLFAPRHEFGDALADAFATAGRRVVCVRPGSGFARDGSDFEVDPTSAMDMESLLRAVGQTGNSLPPIVHAWTLDATSQTSIAERKAHGFQSVLGLGKAIAAIDPDSRLRISVLTRNLQRVAGERSLDPLQALILGPSRVLPREFQNVATQVIDVVDPERGPERMRMAAAVANEILGGATEETVAYRGVDRFVQRLESVRMDRITDRLRPGGRYVITGGLGGIGFVVAQHLAQACAARLVLVGRSATPAAAAARADALRALGSDVEIVQADVADPSQVAMVFDRARQRFGGIDGVFHAAGMLGDSLMAVKSAEDANRVLSPKVEGTLALDEAIGSEPLDLFVLFSSISSIAGLAGQADYTAANAFLDAFAADRTRRRDGLTVSVNWSAWREVGLAANIAAGVGSGSGVGDEVHPVLGRRIWATGDAELFASELSVQEHWVLREHRLRGGACLMPGTGYVELARAAIEARPENRAVEISDLVFRSAFVAPESGSRELRVRLARNPSGAVITIGGRVENADGTVGWQEHAAGVARYVDAPPPGSIDIESVRRRCAAREERFGPDQVSVHMDFGPRWTSLRSIHFGRGEALVALELPPEFEADLHTYRLHPALLDMATGRCDALIDGFDPQRDFYVPLSYTRLRMMAPLTRRLFSHVRVAASELTSEGVIAFDVTITDETGRVLVEVDEFMMTLITDRARLEQGAGAPVDRHGQADFEPGREPVRPPLVRWIEDAITNDEGMAALDRILSGPAIPQLLATPIDAGVMIEGLRQPIAAPTSVADALPTLRRIPEAESALASHAAVAEVIVLERFDRTGKRHVVAYAVPLPGESPTVSELRRHAKRLVAADAVPGTILFIDAAPRTSGGELDAGALHDPFGLADDYVAPRTATEQLIADLWKESLGIRRVGVRDNFFDIGGHSLLAMRAVVKIDRAVGVRLNQAVMVLQTLEQIAADVDRQRAGQVAPSSAESLSEPALGRGLFASLRNAVAGKGK